MSDSKTLIDFAREELERIERERRERLGGEILRINVGDMVVVEMDANAVFKRVNTRFGERVVIPVRCEGESKVLMLNPSGRLYRLILQEILNASRKVKNHSKVSKYVVTIHRVTKFEYHVSVVPVT